ncbi:MAG TPA: hypothetical protein VEK79_23015 [Thermoanaerobaculia bacterium]|nr:hypothetical protein [Thermoanaerobaculia bacterium]
MKRPIELHIGELVLHGFDPHQRHDVGDAVHAELARLLGERGIEVTHGIEISHLDGGSFALRPGARAAGEGIARSVHTALGGKRG